MRRLATIDSDAHVLETSATWDFLAADETAFRPMVVEYAGGEAVKGNDGNAVNFLHGAAVGPFIFLVQAEILAATGRLAGGDLEPGMHEVGASDRAAIAAAWLNYWNR